MRLKRYKDVYHLPKGVSHVRSVFVQVGKHLYAVQLVNMSEFDIVKEKKKADYEGIPYLAAFYIYTVNGKTFRELTLSPPPMKAWKMRILAQQEIEL